MIIIICKLNIKIVKYDRAGIFLGHIVTRTEFVGRIVPRQNRGVIECQGTPKDSPRLKGIRGKTGAPQSGHYRYDTDAEWLCGIVGQKLLKHVEESYSTKVGPAC
jgi:hypothetical protein